MHLRFINIPLPIDKTSMAMGALETLPSGCCCTVVLNADPKLRCLLAPFKMHQAEPFLSYFFEKMAG